MAAKSTSARGSPGWSARGELYVLLSIGSLLLLSFVAIGRDAPVTGMFLDSNGTSYDVSLCIRDGYSNASGTSYDFVGSIGCPLSLQGNDFNMSVDPSGGLALAGDAKTVNVSATALPSGGPVNFSAQGVPDGTTVQFSPSACLVDCYSNATVNTSLSTPSGSSMISIVGSSGPFVRTSYYNLTMIPASCNTNGVCNYPETQSSCSSDCTTTALMQSTVLPGETVPIYIEFRDFRYLAGGSVEMDLTINPEGVSWVPSNGCYFGGKKMAASSGNGAIAWPSDTVSEAGHFSINATCTIPSSLAPGPRTLVATPTIF